MLCITMDLHLRLLWEIIHNQIFNISYLIYKIVFHKILNIIEYYLTIFILQYIILYNIGYIIVNIILYNII